jgi:hypothetical protein
MSRSATRGAFFAMINAIDFISGAALGTARMSGRRRSSDGGAERAA